MNSRTLLNFAKILFTVLFVIWIIIVFILSSQNAEDSGNLSGSFIEKILEVKDEITEKQKSKNIVKNEVLVNSNNINSTNEVKNNEKLNLEENNKKEEQKEKINKWRIQKWQGITRKFAHYTLFAIGGIIIYYMILAYTEKTKISIKNLSITFSIGILNAVFDEFHQFFSDGRTPRMTDVAIDALGIGTGVIIAIIILFIINKIAKIINERGKLAND